MIIILFAEPTLTMEDANAFSSRLLIQTLYAEGELAAVKEAMSSLQNHGTI